MRIEESRAWSFRFLIWKKNEFENKVAFYVERTGTNDNYGCDLVC